ncbi:hypothetical protein MPTK1_2g06710 [Marchantia polymorpha subsp. ruderalis]|uniref:Secreted protein n=1 Tax=Marchantia polymorpha TaxID=3197 RepID=A0A2R6XDT4_MARPO|nr:hypothetical protein MARPO_0021s0124 [Marchantia polymorpha]BBN01344.1 hypothetical protein Mp_2g06710 [Marchantia polymorpha subsp. ruderalis]|eukprot:PTQ44270.1 hypothetical protein MARPO_0021s0124 [Marchantia polymorpha]
MKYLDLALVARLWLGALICPSPPTVCQRRRFAGQRGHKSRLLVTPGWNCVQTSTCGDRFSEHFIDEDRPERARLQTLGAQTILIRSSGRTLVRHLRPLDLWSRRSKSWRRSARRNGEGKSEKPLMFQSKRHGKFSVIFATIRTLCPSARRS